MVVGDLSSNFSRSEFKCKCGCNQDTVDAELIAILEIIRSHFKDRVVRINSGNRCKLYNKKVGGRPGSYHLVSKAADIVVKGVDPHDVYKALDRIYPTTLGLGDANTFTHIDPRPYRVRWRY